MPSRRLWDSVLDLVNNLDARAWRVVWVTVGMIVVVGGILITARILLGDQVEASVRAWLNDAERAHWGLPATIIAFSVSAYFGAPQFVLIAACVVAFGPERGFWYAWLATIVSGGVTFATGRLAGAAALRRYGGATGGRFTRFMDKNAFFASFIVRLLPTAPFIVVNIAMAAAGMKFLPFIAGLALGVLPKTAILTFGYDGIMDALEGNLGGAAMGGAAAIAIWIALAVGLRKFVRKEAQEEENAPAGSEKLEVEAKNLQDDAFRPTGTQ